jgi:hypothetical protein
MSEKLAGYFSASAFGSFIGAFSQAYIFQNTAATILWSSVTISASIAWLGFKIGDRL